MLVPRGRLGARLYLFSPGVTGYLRTTLWNTTRAGFSVASSKVVAADINGDGRDELIALARQGSHGARLWCLAWNGTKLKRTTLWSTTHAPFAVASTSLAAGDLNGDGKADLLLFSQAGTRASLRGFLSSGTKLVPRWHWSGHKPASTRLACGVPSGSAHFAAWLVSPTSAARAALFTLKATSRSFTVHRSWSGALRLRGTQLAAVDLAGAGPVDLVVLGPRGTAGATVTALLPRGSGYAARVAWGAKSGFPASRAALTCAPSLPSVLAPDTVALSSAATAKLTAVSSDLSALTFTGAAPVGVTSGTIILAGPTTLAPQGFLRKVTGVSTSGDQTTLTTAPAALDQAFSSLDVEYSRQLDQGDLAGQKPANGARLGPLGSRERGALRKSIPLPSLSIPVDKTVGPLRLQGNLTVNARVECDLEILPWVGLKSAYVALSGNESSSLSATLVSTLSMPQNLSVDFGLDLPVIPIVPPILTGDVGFGVGVNGDFAQGDNVSIHQGYKDFTVGAKYAAGKYSLIHTSTPTADSYVPTISGSGKVTFSIGPSLSISLCKTLGAYVGPDIYAQYRFNTQATPSPQWERHVGEDLSAGFSAGVFGLGLNWSVVNWNLDFIDEQTVAVTSQPQDNSVAAGQTAIFTVDATGVPSPNITWQVSTDKGHTWSTVASGNLWSYSFHATAGESGNLYRALLTNKYGSAESKAAMLTVGPTPTPTPTPTSTPSPSTSPTPTPTPTSSDEPSLSLVTSVNASDGWAVGYTWDPAANTSKPIILATTNGGAT